MKKLIIQIPCFNEVGQIEACLQSLPTSMRGFDRVETLVVDDGSTDGTLDAARRAGADHLLSLGGHVGLAQVFLRGLEEVFLRHQADVVVNYDADRQYAAEDMIKLLEPIMDGKSDYVLGERPLMTIQHFSRFKKFLQTAGSAFVSFMCGLRISDVTSGYRALNATAALQLSVWSPYTYTLETLIHANELGLRVQTVPIRVNPVVVRPSRLIRSTWQYCWLSVKTVVLSMVRYRPLVSFMSVSLVFWTAALGIGLRFLWYFSRGYAGKMQSLILCAILSCGALAFFLAGVLGETIALNRRILEKIRYDQRLQRQKNAETGSSLR